MQSKSLRELRTEKGWSQEHLAAASKVGKATIQRIEGRKVRLTHQTALSLAAALGADAAKLRAHEGLAGALSRAVDVILNDGTPSDRYLRQLPTPIQRVLINHCNARDAVLDLQAKLAADQATMGQTDKAVSRAHANYMHLARMTITGGDRSLSAVSALAEAGAKAAALDAEQLAATEALRRDLRRLEDAIDIYWETGTALRNLLVRFS